MKRFIFSILIYAPLGTSTALSAGGRLVEIHTSNRDLKLNRGIIVADPTKSAFKINPIDIDGRLQNPEWDPDLHEDIKLPKRKIPIDDPILCPTSTDCGGPMRPPIIDDFDRSPIAYLKPPLKDTIKIPLPTSFATLNIQDCRSIFQAGLFSQSPFLDRVCDRYQVVKDSDNYLHFANRMSRIVSVDGTNYLALDLSDNPSLSFAAWYGSALDIVVSELKNLTDKSQVDIGKPYIGPPKQDLDLKVFVDFQVLGGVNADSDPVASDPSMSVFSSTEVTKYPSLGIFWVKGKLTPYGRSIFQEAAKAGRNLFDVISWEVSHNFKSSSGSVVLTSVGTIPCFRVNPASNNGGLVIAESCAAKGR